MNKPTLILLFLSLNLGLFAQTRIDWSEDYKLNKSDFKAIAPNTGKMQTVYGSFLVGFQIQNFEIIGARNFNSKVYCYFQTNASYIDEGDSISTRILLNYAQLLFDVYEISARKLRQKLLVERKRLMREGSNGIQEELNAEHAKLMAQIQKETENGTLESKISEWDLWAKAELEKLNEFCKECKSTKLKKKQ